MQLHPKHLPEYSFSCFPPFLISLSIAFVSFLLHLSAPLLERNLQSLRGIQFATLSAHLEAIRIASSQNSLHHAAYSRHSHTSIARICLSQLNPSPPPETAHCPFGRTQFQNERFAHLLKQPTCIFSPRPRTTSRSGTALDISLSPTRDVRYQLTMPPHPLI
ncbi:hypothetical protein CABS03_13990 [Colletotrichum abscissum]|uniref:Uncharacterized protein n=1 Tax=Colletotrichum abscissum TaxID=1671311 RepID=A0A9P9X477_9PEZI|nr:hypothetical protein CABS02_12905 [Colletotrichum abscissum]